VAPKPTQATPVTRLKEAIKLNFVMRKYIKTKKNIVIVVIIDETLKPLYCFVLLLPVVDANLYF